MSVSAFIILYNKPVPFDKYKSTLVFDAKVMTNFISISFHDSNFTTPTVNVNTHSKH